MRSFIDNARDWYWRAEDGRIYSSAAGLVDQTAPAYLAWLAPGDVVPTPWPRDEAGEQTDAALQAVLADYGIFLPTAGGLLAYAADKRWQVETMGIVVSGMEIATDRASQSMITGAHAYVLANPDAEIKFKATSGWVTLDAAAVTAIATMIGAHVQACFAAEEAVGALIGSGDITTPAEIDAYPWPSASETA